MVEAGKAPSASAGPASPRNVAGGLILLAIAGFALWLTSDLPRGTLRSAGPAMLPQAVAVMMAVCGIVLVITGWLKHSAEEHTRWSLRGPAFISLGIASFAFTIKEMHFGALSTFELGLVVSGPLAIIIGGHASPHARIRDLLILGFGLTAFCMLLFGDMLNLPIPLFPRAIADGLFSGWSYRGALRIAAGILIGAAAIIWLTTRSKTPPGTVDVATHDPIG